MRKAWPYLVVVFGVVTALLIFKFDRVTADISKSPNSTKSKYIKPQQAQVAKHDVIPSREPDSAKRIPSSQDPTAVISLTPNQPEFTIILAK